jgi:DNA replication and repair protein RecF
MYLKKFHYSIIRIFRKQILIDSKINCFVGKNGIGKTNVLDAIYHLSYGKLFQSIAVQKIKHGEEFFMIDAEFEEKENGQIFAV